MSLTLEQAIFMRKDLKVRKGKIAAQAAHAAGKVALNASVDVGTGRLWPTHSGVVFSAWADMGFPLQMQWVDNEEALLTQLAELAQTGLPVARIVDQGRTEFNGRPTLTCGAAGPELLYTDVNAMAAPAPRAQEAKQVLVVRKDLKLDKVAIAEAVAQASLQAWVSQMEVHIDGWYLPLPEGSALDAWLNGPFAKIVVGVADGDALDLLTVQAQAAGLLHARNEACLAVGPDWPEQVNLVTSKLKLL